MKWTKLEYGEWHEGMITLIVGKFNDSGFLAHNYDERWAFELFPFWKHYYVPLEMPE